MTTIVLKNTSTPDKVPTTSQLTSGELAVNTYDGKVYTKINDGTGTRVKQVGGGAVTVSDTEPTNPDAGDQWFNEADNIMYAYDGTIWFQVTNATSIIELPPNNAIQNGTAEGEFAFWDPVNSYWAPTRKVQLTPATGKVTFQNDVEVQGTLTLSTDLNSPGTVGNFNIGGDLSVTGDASIVDMDVTGTATIASADITSLGVNNATPETTLDVDGSVRAATNTASLSGAASLDFATHQNHVLTLTGNVTLSASNAKVGQSGFITFIQNSAGGHTLSISSDFETEGGRGITLSSDASATDIVPYVVAASGRILLGAPQLGFS